MAHDGLMNRSIVAGGEVLELVTTVNQGRGWGEFPGRQALMAFPSSTRYLIIGAGRSWFERGLPSGSAA